jgi:hypothetical protein
MGTRRDKQIDEPAADSPGRISVDSRGRNVWQWNDDQLDSTTIMLKSLENSALALEPTRKLRRPRIPGDDAANPSRSRSVARDGEQTGELRIEQTLSFKPGGGFDPYNSS